MVTVAGDYTTQVPAEDGYWCFCQVSYIYPAQGSLPSDEKYNPIYNEYISGVSLKTFRWELILSKHGLWILLKTKVCKDILCVYFLNI